MSSPTRAFQAIDFSMIKVFSDSRRNFLPLWRLTSWLDRLVILACWKISLLSSSNWLLPMEQEQQGAPTGAKVGSAGWLEADGSNREPTPPFPGFLMLRGDGSFCRKIILGREREKQSLIILLSMKLVIVYHKFSPVRDKPLEFGTVT